MTKYYYYQLINVLNKEAKVEIGDAAKVLFRGYYVPLTKLSYASLFCLLAGWVQLRAF